MCLRRTCLQFTYIAGYWKTINLVKNIPRCSETGIQLLPLLWSLKIATMIFSKNLDKCPVDNRSRSSLGRGQEEWTGVVRWSRPAIDKSSTGHARPRLLRNRTPVVTNARLFSLFKKKRKTGQVRVDLVDLGFAEKYTHTHHAVFLAG